MPSHALKCLTHSFAGTASPVWVVDIEPRRGSEPIHFNSAAPAEVAARAYTIAMHF
jgi:hypothetical protein